MAVKKIGRVWRTKKRSTDVVMSGQLIDGAKIGIIRAKDKNKRLIPDTYDVIAFVEPPVIKIKNTQEENF
ncbi:MAG: hypothetical protein KatS3mg096_696 [Candidatus Parcubacteria bacterium]|nr:MAG: hypothetical protein KatS3mg096_669 [Candidatus Parcubacteria bacterium]GIW67828.1 MAG: hypothetical protein KatS3mg096_696 [Candidatus Parcubacteria bacterium]